MGFSRIVLDPSLAGSPENDSLTLMALTAQRSIDSIPSERPVALSSFRVSPTNSKGFINHSRMVVEWREGRESLYLDWNILKSSVSTNQSHRDLGILLNNRARWLTWSRISLIYSPVQFPTSLIDEYQSRQRVKKGTMIMVQWRCEWPRGGFIETKWS